MKLNLTDLNIWEIQLIQRLKNKRIELNLTQEKLAKKSGFSRMTIIDFENFHKRPTYKIIEKISRSLGFSDSDIDEFRKFIEKRNKPDYSSYKITGVKLSDSFIFNENKFKLLDATNEVVFVPGRIVDIILKIPYIYAVQIKDKSNEPVIKQDDFVVVKYTKKINLEQLQDDNIVVLANSKKDVWIRKVKRIYYHSSSLSGFAQSKKLILFEPLNPESYYAEYDWDNRNPSYGIYDDRVFVIDKKSDIKVIGVVLTIINGNMLNNIELDILIDFLED